MADEDPSQLVKDAGNSPASSRDRKGTRLGGFLGRLVSHIPPGQFLRYLIVGAWNTMFGYGMFALFTALLMRRMRYGYVVAQVLANFFSITVAFLGYKLFVFNTKGNYLREWLKCVAVYGTGMLPGLFLLPILVQGLHLVFHLGRSAPYVGGAILMGFGVIYSFLGHKNFSFRVPEDAPEDFIHRAQREAAESTR